MTVRPAFPFDNSYARLPQRFYAELPPTPVAAPRLIRLNRPLARHLGLDADALDTPEGAEILAGNRVPDGAHPLAMAYAGHQFGNWVPQLGDGRAILLGEVVDAGGVRRDIQLKGAGRTPFSRMGDGRAAIGPVLREYVISEAMAAMGVPTTRSLAAVTTGEPVIRERVLPGAVLTRVARSHIRVGTFQFFGARADWEAVRLLADHVIGRHHPQAREAAKPHAALFDAILTAQAELIAQWMGIGFIHGVMNTDNMSIAGETIDYGPCAFMDSYHPETVYSSIDQAGRYAYGNQPGIGQWNLACLAQAMLPLLGEDEAAAVEVAKTALEAFRDRYKEAWLGILRRKTGLARPHEDDARLIQDLLDAMAANQADFTLTFRGLSDLPADRSDADEPVRALFVDPTAFDGWAARWRRRLADESRGEAERRADMRAANPAFIPRNHLVEEAIEAAIGDDFAPFATLVEVLARPFDDQPDFPEHRKPPREDQIVRRTFCGT